ncbi:FecR domain-containing protein [Rhizobium sp. AG855]|uniref:FecR domain-containing protein n=1 Tax=Rhizobium sp. AG855 TaxID=2183898 RepID=UPI000E76CA3F|nr:FecR domain-containing protein [Rhizobium sp. AG855]RKE85766.1 FecR family protein [Rhizobium sp. AG855]
MNRILSTSALLAASVAMSMAAAAPSRAEANVAGVTAAVNPTASALQPGGKRKLISLGDPVVRDQRIETGPEGLVQILLADGTSFTVGPNSSIVIDSFVYDPEKQTASLAATMTKGALRFIGGKASKASGDVKIDTPIGTAGIRGAVVDINLDGRTADGQVIPPHVSLVFGKQVELNSRGSSERLFRPGFSIVAGDGGNSVKRTPSLWVSSLQQYLAGRPGMTGGAKMVPTDQSVRNSQVATSNSQQPVAKNNIPVPRPRPLPVTAPDEIAATSTRDNTRPEVPEENPGAEVPVPSSASVSVGVGSLGKVNTRSGTVTQNADGTITGSYGADSFILPALASTSSLTSQTVNGTANGAAVSGTAYTGSNGFVAYLLTNGSGDPFYVIGGTPANATSTLSSGQILHYVLKPDVLNAAMVNADGITIPFTSGFPAGPTVASDLLVAGVSTSNGKIGRAMQASLLIDGAGTSQTSAINVTAGSIGLLQGGGYGLTGSTAGSGRDTANSQASHGQGITTSIGSTAGGDQFYGSGGEYLVVGTGSLPTVDFGDPDGEFQGYDYLHVAGRNDAASTAAVRSFGSQTRTGFSSWVLRSFGSNTIRAGRATVTFDATQGTFTGGITSVGGDYYADFYGNDDRTYLSDTLMAATSSKDGTYMVSSAAVPAKIFNGNTSAQICTSCEFMTWGWWGRNLYGEVDYKVHLGNWIIGERPANTAVPTTGSATYTGNAVGTVLNNGAQYIATGNLAATMNFGARTGTVEISNYDGKGTFGANVSFQSGGNPVSTLTSSSMIGIATSVTGAFASDGTGTPSGNVRGVMGNFTAVDGTWSSTGIFAGSTTGVVP